MTFKHPPRGTLSRIFPGKLLIYVTFIKIHMLAVILMIFYISFSAVQCDNTATVMRAIPPPTTASPTPSSERSIDLVTTKHQPAAAFNETAVTNDEQHL